MLTLIFSASSALFTEKHGGWVSLVPALAVFDFRVVYPAHQPSLAAIPPALRCAALPAVSWERLRAFPTPVFVPLALPERTFQKHSLNMPNRPARYLFERSFPVEPLRKHPGGQLARVWLRRGQLQSVRRNAQSIRQNDGTFHRVLQFAYIPRPAIRQQSLFRFRRELQSWLLELSGKFLQKIFRQ